jgi:hypothetical protein
MALAMMDIRGSRHAPFGLAFNAQRMGVEHLSPEPGPTCRAIPAPRVVVLACVLGLHRVLRAAVACDRWI